MMVFHRCSKIFQPITVIPKNSQIKRHEFTSKSQKLLLEMGLIRQANPGCFHFLPLGIRSLEKLISLVDQEMQNIGGQKVIFPTLTNSKLWNITGRLDAVSSELFQLEDRHQQRYILSPTHEEAATDLLASLAPLSYKQLPLRLYQITNKYRDEMKPRFGLIRAKQFLMKDMYSFDNDSTSSRQTYEEICNSYQRIFSKIGINFIQVLGSSGHMGGELSHEFHYKAEIGDDKILTCPHCHYSANVELVNSEKCPKCNNSVDITCGIEIAHTFSLGEKYSKPLNATYLASDGKPKFLQMGSYGIGLSRLLAASVEVLSTEQEMRWPLSLAPFSIIILPPKNGSKEEKHLKESNFIDTLYRKIEQINNLKGDVLVDDRLSLTIGRRYMEAKRVGYPFIVAIGKHFLEDPPLYELTDLKTSKQMNLSENDLFSYFNQNTIL